MEFTSHLVRIVYLNKMFLAVSLYDDRIANIKLKNNYEVFVVYINVINNTAVHQLK